MRRAVLEKMPGEILTAPRAQYLSFTGNSQNLTTSGTGTGTVVYSLNGGSFSTTIPTASSTGSYTIRYKALESVYYYETDVFEVVSVISETLPSYTAPTARTLTYNGNAQTLLNAGTVSGGTMLYSIDGSTWSTTIPSKINAGTYPVYWKITGDANHSDVGPETIRVTIGKLAGTLSYSNPTVNIATDGTTVNPLSKTADGAVTYSSSDTSVATVDANGNITALKLGSCTITATLGNGTNYSGGATASYTLNVNDYLCLTPSTASTFTMNNNTYYSLDRGATWTALSANTASPSVASGNTILWKAGITPSSETGVGTFTATGSFSASGNPMSLLYGDSFTGHTSLADTPYALAKLFQHNTYITDASNLDLNATAVSDYCYYCMFEYCSNLTGVPELPATTLGIKCYSAMFSNTAITTTPALPATNLAVLCYDEMFYNCASLRTAPALPATTLVDSCYTNMFGSCTSLTTAPDLLAKTLVTACYWRMFHGCTSLTSIKMMATDISAEECLYCWVTNVAPSGTLTYSGVAIPDGENGLPIGWTAVVA